MILFIADDDEDDKEMFFEVVADISRQHICKSATNGQEALLALQNATALPDFIFLDLNMPRMNGKQCLIELKKDPRLASIPVVIYSTLKSAEDKEELIALGACYFLTKPNSAQKLKKELQIIFTEKCLPALSK